MSANTASACARRLAIGMAGTALCAFASAATAQTATEPDLPEREHDEPQQIIVYGRALDEIGIARSGSQGTVGYADFDAIPISRVGELLENVPGLIATQHSGSGKANQFFCAGSTSITARTLPGLSMVCRSKCARMVTGKAISTSIS